MKEFTYFLIGITVGAVFALLLAPESGEKLRGQIGQEVTDERRKLDMQLNNAMAKMEKRIELMHADLTAYIHAAEQKSDA